MSDLISCPECGSETEWWHEIEHLPDCTMPAQVAERKTGDSEVDRG